MSDNPDPFDLARFVKAQDRDGTYERALAELCRGRKTSHWMWFVFPQIAGLGRSATSQYFAITSVDEARAYLDHPILGARLIECAAVVAGLAGPVEAVLGPVDAQKLQSSMTLFARARPEEPTFAAVLARHFDEVADAATDDRL